MNERPTVVLLGASRERYARATSALADTAFVSNALSAIATQVKSTSRIVLVDLAADLERGLRAVQEVRQVIAQVQVVALADAKDPDLILRAMRAGACEFAVLDEGRELNEIVRTLLRRTTAESASGTSGTIISIFPTKGGIGATTLAVNLACALCEQDRRVLLIDLDRHFGDVLAFLDLAPRNSIADIAHNLHRLDRELLLSSLARHASGPFVVAQPHALDDGETVGPSQITALLQLMARHFDYIVCDGLRGLDELSVGVLDASHRIELLLTQDVISLKNAKRCLELFERLGYDKDKVEPVVNGFHAKASIDLGSMAENLGIDVRATIAIDDRSAMAALNRGVPVGSVAPHSKAVHDIADLAARLSGTKREARRGFFRGLLRHVASRRIDSESRKENEGGFDVPRRAPEAT